MNANILCGLYPELKAVFIFLGFLLVQCTVDPDLEGRNCPCVDGWICDINKNVCINLEEGDYHGTIVPLYASPQGSDAWTRLVEAKAKHPRVKVVVVINPNNGPGESKRFDYEAGIEQLKSAGCIVIGYVTTDYAKSDNSSNIKSQVKNYIDWYPKLDGIMFDQMLNDVAKRDYYSDLGDYAKTLGFTITVGNPGAPVTADLIGIFDVLLIYNNAGLPSLSTLSQWKPYAGKFGIISYGVSSLDTAFIDSAKSDVRYIYLTDDGDTDPWNTVPSYFESMLGALE